MSARLPRASMGQVVLLASPESFHPTQLLSRQHFVRVSPLAATLMDFPASVANKRLTARLSPLDSALTKNRGWGNVMVNQRPLSSNIPTRNSHSETQGPHTTIILALSFHSFTNCPFSIPFVLTFMHRMGGVPLPTSQRSHVSTCRRVRSHQSRVTTHVPCYNLPPMARQRLGQHFLSDLHWREEIARAIRVSPHSTVPLPQDGQHCWIEIGSGHGEMTEHLVAAGAPVHAIELDPAFIAGLHRLAQKFPNLTVVPGDILEADIAAIASGRRIFIYGNLPYYITSPILQHLFTFADLIDEIHVVIQSEVAARL